MVRFLGATTGGVIVVFVAVFTSADRGDCSNDVFGPYASEEEAWAAVEALADYPGLNEAYWIRVEEVKPVAALSDWWEEQKDDF